MESVRKDIECCFGVLKGRWRVLKLPVQARSKEHIDDIFFTCVCLHNILHDWNGRDQWENGLHWGGADGLHEADSEEDINWARPRMRGDDGVCSCG